MRISYTYLRCRKLTAGILLLLVMLLGACSEDKRTSHIPANTPEDLSGHLVTVIRHAMIPTRFYLGDGGYQFANNEESVTFGRFESGLYLWRVETINNPFGRFEELDSGSINLIHDMTCHIYLNAVVWD